MWFELGWNLPNAPVSDLRYDATDDILLAGTHGRGAWTVPQASQVLPATYDLRGFSCDVPDKIDWGDPFTLTGRVINHGGAPLNGSFLQEFRLSNDLTWFDDDDEVLGLFTHTRLCRRKVWPPASPSP